MIGLLFRKSVRESRWLLLGCAGAIFAFCWLRVWIVSRLSTERFRAILEMLPGDWRRFLTVDFDWLITYPGRISMGYQELIVVLGMTVWSITRGSDVVSGELNRGTMEMLLAQPLSRSQVMMTQSAIGILGVAVLAVSAWGGTCAGVYTTSVKESVPTKIPLPFYVPGIGNEVAVPLTEAKTERIPMSSKVSVRMFIPASVNLFALGFTMIGFTTLMSSWDRYRWRTIGLVSAVFVAELLLKIAGMAMEDWRWLTYLSFLSAYEPESHVRLADTAPDQLWTWWIVDANGTSAGPSPLVDNLLLLAIGAASFIGASVIFSRRDLPAPL